MVKYQLMLDNCENMQLIFEKAIRAIDLYTYKSHCILCIEPHFYGDDREGSLKSLMNNTTNNNKLTERRFPQLII